MSFILDALKKSELERQRQAIPGLVEAGIARPRQRLPGWAIAVCVLLGINLAVLLAVLARGWMNTRPAGSPAAVVPAADNPAAPDTAGRGERDSAGSANGDQPWSPLDGAAGDAAPVYAPEVPVTSSAPMAEALPAAATAPVARQPSTPGNSAAHAVRRHDPVLNDRNYQPDEEENLPSVSQMNLTGAQALPELHLDVHVYATNSAERFVFINMRKYHEGATLQEGPTIERIRRDGVILNYQGLRFLLPRQ
jgi:general secretion pathway protein B